MSACAGPRSRVRERCERVAAGLPREPVLVGHSLGGLVVQKYLEAHEPPAAVLLAPPSVRGLLGPAVRTFRQHPWLSMQVILTGTPRRLLARPELVRKFSFSPELGEEQVREYAACMGAESFRAFLELVYIRPDRARIRGVPLLVLGGGGDYFIRPSAIRRIGGRVRRRVHDPARRRARHDAGRRLASGRRGDAGVAGADARVWRAIVGFGRHRSSPPHPEGCSGTNPPGRSPSAVSTPMKTGAGFIAISTALPQRSIQMQRFGRAERRQMHWPHAVRIPRQSRDQAVPTTPGSAPR